MNIMRRIYRNPRVSEGERTQNVTGLPHLSTVKVRERRFMMTPALCFRPAACFRSWRTARQGFYGDFAERALIFGGGGLDEEVGMWRCDSRGVTGGVCGRKHRETSWDEDPARTWSRREACLTGLQTDEAGTLFMHKIYTFLTATFRIGCVCLCVFEQS